MKKIFLILSILFFSCKSQENIVNDTKTKKISYHRLRVDKIDYLLSYDIPKDKDVRLGFLDSKGKVIVNPTFNNCTDFYGDFANIIKDSVYGYVDKRGAYKTFENFDKVFWYYSDIGFAIKNKKYALINRKGELITNFEYDRIEIPNEGYFPVLKDGKWNFLNSNGKLLFTNDIVLSGNPIYDSMTIFYNNEKDDKKPKQGIIDINNNIIIKPIYDEVSGSFSNGLMRVKKQNLYGFVNSKDEIVIPIEYEDVGFDFYRNLISAKMNGKWGYINTKNEIITPFIYDRIYPFSNDLSMVIKNGKSGYIDVENEIIIPINLEATWRGSFKENIAVFKKGEKWGYINKKGRIIIPAIYDSALQFDKGMGHVILNKKEGFIDKQGNKIIGIKYTQLWGMENNRIRFVE
ncbi:WG repeat-containing protein [Aquimarina algiphila]|uniref:WG repeat-containing protein n=1 Tax=Aquimarina algiphila TaxID=2047982 RepID=UPI00232AB8D8|nr:WG repeat-containing protein [Aquimarina algiphila]